MGLSTAFYTVDGEIIAESSSGTRLDYFTDALGSVTAKADPTATVISSARYKPYGEKLSGSDHTFGWVGSHGYRKAVGGTYVRARHSLKATANWASQDPLWPSESGYTYVSGNPSNRIDPSGLVQITRSRSAPRSGWPPECRAYSVYWKFNINSSSATGWLVQEINHKGAAYICDSNLEWPTCGKYYEVWLVINGKIFFPNDNSLTGSGWSYLDVPTDHWHEIDLKCTYGYSDVTGSLAFFEDLTATPTGTNLWLIMSNFLPGSHVGCSGPLPSTRFFIPNGFTSGWTAPGSLSNTWACCKKRKDSCDDGKQCEKCLDHYGPCFENTFSLSPDNLDV